MKKAIFIISTLLIVMQLSFTQAQMITYKYDFNNLTIGANLNGQDGWTSVVNTGSTYDLVVGYNMAGPGTSAGTGSTTPDNTLGVFYDYPGPNYGRTASRVTTTGFPFNFAIGGIMEIQVDMCTAWWGDFFGIGYDKNNNGYLVPGVEQQVAYEANEGGIGIYLSDASAANCVFMKPDGTKIPIVYDSMSLWNTWKIFIDFDANSGAGAASLFAKKPNGNFVNIPAVQNLNLGLTPGSADRKDPAKWSKIFIQALGGYSAFDNISISQPNTGGLLYQYIMLSNPPTNHLTTDAPFVIHPVSSRGLPVTCSIIGPATISGDTLVTLTGDTGVVKIIAKQPGTITVAPAANDTIIFNVYNPLYIFPNIDIKNPVDNNIVRAPHLDPIQMSFATSIDHTDLLSVSGVTFTLNGGQTINAKATNNGYYIGYWTPPAFGTYSLTATAHSSGGVSTQKVISFQVVPDSAAINLNIINALHFADETNQKLDTTELLPSFTGTYTKITAVLKYECPPEGCDPWDIVSYINIRGANGDWVELVRYITPYALACGDSLDVTDFASQLQGKIDIRSNFPSDSKVTLTLNYKAGTPTYKYTWMDKLWLGSYPMGTYTTGGVALQPVEVRQLKLSDTNIDAAYIRVMTTDHGGPNNTSNAAEFYELTHHFKINGTTTFSQDLWRTCNPNPTGCSPQSGTWQYARAGWCPGSIPMLWRYDVSSKIGNDVSLMYEFAPSYIDMCSSFNPNCVTSSSCTCTDTYNPTLYVGGELVTYYGGVPADMYADYILDYFKLNVYPNPSAKGIFNLTATRRFNNTADVRVYNLQGVLLKEFKWNGEQTSLNLSDFSKGIYVMKVSNTNGVETKKLIIQ